MSSSGSSKCAFTSQQQKRKENQCKNTELGEKPGQTDRDVCCQEICPGKRLKHFWGWGCDLCEEQLGLSILQPATPPSQAPKGSCSNSQIRSTIFRDSKGETENLGPDKDEKHNSKSYFYTVMML